MTSVQGGLNILHGLQLAYSLKELKMPAIHDFTLTPMPVHQQLNNIPIEGTEGPILFPGRKTSPQEIASALGAEKVTFDQYDIGGFPTFYMKSNTFPNTGLSLHKFDGADASEGVHEPLESYLGTNGKNYQIVANPNQENTTINHQQEAEIHGIIKSLVDYYGKIGVRSNKMANYEMNNEHFVVNKGNEIDLDRASKKRAVE